MKLLEKLACIHSMSGHESAMANFIISYAKHYSNDVIYSNGNVYITKGKSDTYPCLVAHMDQVQANHSDDFEMIISNDMAYGYSAKNDRREGCGFDDKAGIWIALKALSEFDCIKLAFFWGEEIGCLGSDKANMEFFDDVRFVIQADKKGNNAFVTNIGYTELCDNEFFDLSCAKSYGYENTSGLMTDVEALKLNGLKVCACNIACGYMMPHTDEEYIVISDLENCKSLIFDMIRRLGDVYSHICRDEYYDYYDNYDLLYSDRTRCYEFIEYLIYMQRNSIIDEYAAICEADSFGLSKEDAIRCYQFAMSDFDYSKF